MLNFIRLCLGTLARLFCSRRSLMLENLALRQQLAVFKRRNPRPRLNLTRPTVLDCRSTALVRLEAALVIVVPDTVVQLASSWIQALLAYHFESSGGLWWQEANFERNSGFDLPDGRGESDLGSTANPRRASHARL